MVHGLLASKRRYLGNNACLDKQRTCIRTQKILVKVRLVSRVLIMLYKSQSFVVIRSVQQSPTWNEIFSNLLLQKILSVIILKCLILLEIFLPTMFHYKVGLSLYLSPQISLMVSEALIDSEPLVNIRCVKPLESQGLIPSQDHIKAYVNSPHIHVSYWICNCFLEAKAWLSCQKIKCQKEKKQPKRKVKKIKTDKRKKKLPLHL